MKAKYKPSDYEAFRKRCVEMKEAGWHQKDISAALGLTEGWVSQTLKKYRESVMQGLSARKATGAPPRMTTRSRESWWRDSSGELGTTGSAGKFGLGSE